jgi:spore coat polysaccharide biosynthesis predicted glycosyltransferase SpsG
MSAVPSVLFLTVAGAGAGLGHVKRCAALSSALARLGARVRFAVAGDPERLTATGMSLPGLEPLQWTRSPRLAIEAVERSRPDVVVVDAYDATDELLRTLRSSGGFIAAIDDLADRELPVDLVVNRASKAERRPYADVPGRRLLLGPRYALLDQAFEDVPARATRPVPSRVLVTLGGEDAELMLTEAVAAVEGALPEASIEVVAGLFARSAPARGARVTLRQGLSSLYDLLLSADFAVTAAGMTLYECLAAGTPAVAVPVAENQRPEYVELTDAGLVVPGQPDLAAAVKRISRDAALRGKLAASGRELVDGRGAARVAAEMISAVAQAAPSAGPARGAR